MESLRSGVGVCSHSVASVLINTRVGVRVWNNSGAGVGVTPELELVFGVTLEQLFGVTPELE